MIRKCFVMQLKQGAEEEYRQRHSPIWKELEDVLRTHGVHNYSITLHSETGHYIACDLGAESGRVMFGRLGSLAALRQVVRDSFVLQSFEPIVPEAWRAAYQRFIGL
jgi:L-rhamnose mutarotase-like protein